MSKFKIKSVILHTPIFLLAIYIFVNVLIGSYDEGEPNRFVPRGGSLLAMTESDAMFMVSALVIFFYCRQIFLFFRNRTK